LSDQPIDKVISCLNEAFAADPLAMRLLLINRVQCNRSLADHPTIVCDDCAPFGLPDQFTLGSLGLVNGVLGALGLPLVASGWSDQPDAEGRHTLLGFRRYQQADKPAPEGG
jgi:hypothetical protein